MRIEKNEQHARLDSIYQRKRKKTKDRGIFWSESCRKTDSNRIRVIDSSLERLSIIHRFECIN
jgi:hypothetical protein